MYLPSDSKSLVDVLLGLALACLTRDPPADDTELLQKQRAGRARRFTLGEDSLIRQRSTGKLGVPTSLRSSVLAEAHDSPVGGHFGA